MADYGRGVLITGLGSYGYVQNVGYSRGGSEVRIQNETGITKVHEIFDHTNEVTAVVKFDRDTTPPGRGDTITLAACSDAEFNGKYNVLTKALAEVNTDAPELTFTLIRFDEGDVPAT